MPAPIALFAFNRPDLLRRSVAALARNELAAQSALTVFCDGPRHDADRPLTEAVRSFARQISGFASLEVVERDANLGCANAVIAGLAEMFSAHTRLIVIEDDVLCSPYTLRFLNECLEKYEEESTVFSTSAWGPPLSAFFAGREYPYDVYAIPRFDCLAWASWKDRWEKVDWAVSDYNVLCSSPVLQRALNAGGEDMTRMLHAQFVEKSIDSWAIRYDYARFKHGCLGLNPVHPYVLHIGWGRGTHTKTVTTRYDSDLALAVPRPRLPGHIFVDAAIRKAYYDFYSPPPPLPLPVRAVNKLSRLLLGRNLLQS